MTCLFLAHFSQLSWLLPHCAQPQTFDWRNKHTKINRSSAFAFECGKRRQINGHISHWTAREFRMKYDSATPPRRRQPTAASIAQSRSRCSMWDCEPDRTNRIASHRIALDTSSPNINQQRQSQWQSQWQLTQRGCVAWRVARLGYIHDSGVTWAEPSRASCAEAQAGQALSQLLRYVMMMR